MSNTSATGGYLTPSSSSGLPGGLTLTQFIQTVIVGISGIAPASLVRPKWQVKPIAQPDVAVNWIAYGIELNRGDANAYVQEKADGSGQTLQRMEELAVAISFYGPDALENWSLFRDGLQITQNLEALQIAKMGFKEISEARRVPELLNERWFNRYECVLTLVRQVQRVYPVLSFVSVSGTVHTELDEGEYTFDFTSPLPEG